MASNSGAPVKDARFQKVHNDPRFARNSKRKNKLQIDKRFAGVFQDARFQTGAGKYDKYGRRIKQKGNELKKFYELEDNDEEDNDEEDNDEDDDDAASKSDDDDDDDSSDDDSTAKAAPRKKSSTTSSASDDEEQDATVAKNDEKLTRLEYLNRMARGELADGSSDSDSDDSDSDDSDDDSKASEPESEKEDVPMGEETKRFAVLSCDWSRIRAVDLFALCQSFAPATGAVRDVTIYPSDYGLQKMKEEEQFGPQGLWSDDKKQKQKAKDQAADDDDSDAAQDKSSDEEGGDGSDDDSDDDGYDSDDPLGVKQRVDASDDNGFDSEKLRKYELQKLKYYYAVVTCDSVKTASAIFDACDQLEYETSANVLDLRFVPDDVEFTNTPKDSCTHVPESYKPAIFATTALQNTDVKLTWEEDDENRMELLTRQAEWKDADDNDFAAYLASDHSSDGGSDSDDVDSEDDEAAAAASDDEAATGSKKTKSKKAAKLQKLKSRYRKMLLGSDAEDDSDDAASGGDDDEADDDDNAKTELAGGEMEMTFTPGARDILKAKKQRELEAQETPFERYAREKKAQKNAKLHDKRAQAKALEREQKAVLQKKGRGATQAKLLREAVADGGDSDEEDPDGGRNFDLKAIQKREKVAGLKGKRKAKEMQKLRKHRSELQQGFAFDAADPRFGALYAKGSQFQLDPTDPKFKKTEANQAIFQERRKRTEQAGNTGGAQPKAKAKATAEVPAASAGESKSELKAMVENLKRKSQQQQKSKKKQRL